MNDPAPLREAFEAGIDVGYADITGRTAPQSFKDKAWSKHLSALPTDAVQPVGGVDREAVAWLWLNAQQECSPADIDYSADQMVDAFMAGWETKLRAEPLRAALEKIAADGPPYRNGYCQTDIAVDPALTAQEAQDVARTALYATAPTAGSGWVPIESAPKDEVILLYGPIGYGANDCHPTGPIRACGYWDEIDSAWAFTDTTWEGPFMDPTHWMPLPAAPTVGGE